MAVDGPVKLEISITDYEKGANTGLCQQYEFLYFPGGQVSTKYLENMLLLHVDITVHLKLYYLFGAVPSV